MGRKSSHRKALEKIASNPTKFGFKNIIAVAIEPTLIDKRGRLISSPDLILYSSNREVYVVEYKGNGDERLLKRAQEQVYNSIRWFSKYTSYIPKVKILNGEYHKRLFRD